MTKVVITSAGKGTRLLPFTKEMPKEMMPIFSNMGKKKIQTMGTYIYEEEGDMKQNVPYQEFKREINNIKDRLNSIEEEQYIM